MKKLFILLSIVLAVVSCRTDSNREVSIPNDELNALIREYKDSADFNVIKLGSFSMSIAKSAVKIAASLDDDDIQTILSQMDGVKALTVVEYEDASRAKKAEFNFKLGALLPKEDLIMEVKDDDDIVRIYGAPSEQGIFDNLIVFCENDDVLVRIYGKISMQSIGKISR